MSAIIHKTVPECRVIVKTREGIPYRPRGGSMVVSSLGDRMALAQGDAGGMFQPYGKAWQGNPQSGFNEISETVDFIRFHKDGTVTEGASNYSPTTGEVAGMTLKPREVQQNATMGNQSVGTGELPPIAWAGMSGNAIDWTTVRLFDGQAAIVNAGLDNDVAARTVNKFQANQGAKTTVQFSAKSNAGTDMPYCAVSWGDESYRVFMPHDLPPQVEKNVDGSWVILRRMGSKCNLAGGSHSISWVRRGGRLTVKFDERSEHFLELGSDGEPIFSTWPAGSIAIRPVGCRARAAVSLLTYKDETGGSMSGTYTMREKMASYVEPDVEPDVVDGGYLLDSQSAKTDYSWSDGKVESTTTVTSTADGTDAPLHTVKMAQYPIHTTTNDEEGVDIGPAVVSAHLSQAMPPIMPGAELTLSIDRVLLDGMFGAGAWQDHLDSYCPLTFESRWHYSDGSTGPWIKYFTGYVFQKELSTAEIADGKMTVTCRDPIVRLQNPAAIIDHRYPPLEFLFGKKARDRQRGGAQSLSSLGLWGVECVHEILRIALGSVEAFALNNAGGDLSFLLRYFPRDENGTLTHYPLYKGKKAASYLALEWVTTSSPPTDGALIFPPPYGDDALSWINQIATKDHAVFFYGQPDGYNGDFPSPMYGRITEIVKARNVTHLLPDGIYSVNPPESSWEANQAFQSAQWGSRPENEINRWMVLANGPLGDATEAFLPAFRIGIAQTVAPDPNAPEFSWERTQVIRDELSWFPGAAEAYANLTRDLLKNVLYRWPSITCRGRDYGADVDFEAQPGLDPLERPINWGDVVVLKMTDSTFSDSSIELNGNEYRVEHVEQDWTFDGDADHTMQVWVRPRTSGGF